MSDAVAPWRLDTRGSSGRHRIEKPTRAGAFSLSAVMRRISWPLPVVLAVQAMLSLRLVRSNTAFIDEALYLRSGHLEIAHWLHGTPIPAFPTYFSGAPILYPPLGAIADGVGGLAGARILSLCFMLGVTSLLWATTMRLYGRYAAFFGSALFAVLGPTLHLGAFATFDSMALLLIALAAWCAVRAAQERDAMGWLVGTAVALTLANATKYASTLFDPVVLGLLAAHAHRISPWRQALARAGTALGYTVGMLLFLLTFGGGEYLTGLKQTTLLRATGTESVSTVLGQAWHLTAVVLVLAALAVAVGLRTQSGWSGRLVLIVLACAGLLVPAEQAHIHTTTSLDKHTDFGVWFACIAAGYLVNTAIGWARSRALQRSVALICLGLVAVPAYIGSRQARDMFRSWPNSAALVSTLRSVLPGTNGPILDDSNRTIPQYYLPGAGSQWYRWSNDSSLRLPGGKSVSATVDRTLDPTLFADRIRSGYFSVVVLNFGGAAAFDQQLIPVLQRTAGYHLVARVPYGGRDSQVWEYRPQSRFHDLKATGSGASHSLLSGLLTPTPKLRPILGSIGAVTAFSGVAVLLFTFLVRFGWRRGKANNEI